MRRWKAPSGMITTLSWSWPKLEKPLRSSTPTTVQLVRLTRIASPVGSPAPKNACRTVSPMTQLLVPARTSESVNRRPSAADQSRAMK